MYDSLYWLLGGIMLVAFVAAIARSVADLPRPSADRWQPEGIVAISIGALLSLVVGFSLNALRSVTGDLFYQQAHFALFYVAFGLILWGFDRVGMLGDHVSSTRLARRAIAWSAFALTTGIAVLDLLTPDGYRVVSGGDVRYVQEPLFFLPLFVVLVVGATRLPSWLDAAQRRTAQPWLAAFAALMMLGLLRESTIMPATDQPIVDLLLAFGPFTLAALCVYRAASLGTGAARGSREAAAAQS